MVLKTAIKIGNRNNKIGKQTVVLSSGELLDGGAKHGIGTWVLGLIACLVIGGLIGYIYFQQQFVGAKNAAKLSEKDATIALLEDENKRLLSEMENLSEKVEILSMTVNTKVAAEAELTEQLESAALPSELPVSGAVSLEETVEVVPAQDSPLGDVAEIVGDTGMQNNEGGLPIEVVTETVERPICLFTAQVGSMVVSAGSGVVISVKDDSNFGHSVAIDHGNGYITIYRNAGDVLVKEGDEISAGATIYYINPENIKLGYQMMLADEYINPMDMLAING